MHPAATPDEIVRLARDESVSLVVIGPEAPLVAGVADALRAAGVPTVGPSAEAARLEGSKVFAKQVMEDAGVPTARSRAVETVADGMAAVTELGLPVAIKADGLAAGKGVTVARDADEARGALVAALEESAFGAAGSVCLVEEGLVGPEVSLIALSDGRRCAWFPAARDYKPVGEGNTGPNTGGMGAFSPIPDIPDGLARDLVELVHRPVIARMAEIGAPFSGVLYAGLMLTPEGPRVLEFNVRFGDPETQVLLPRMRSDLFTILLAAAQGKLDEAPDLELDERDCVGVVVASEGYPGAYQGGKPIAGLDDAAALEDVEVFHAGTRRSGGELVTAGGRVLCVTALGKGFEAARQRAYEGVDRITFDGAYVRKDIGWRAVNRR